MSLVIDLIDLVAKHKSGELRCPATALIMPAISKKLEGLALSRPVCALRLALGQEPFELGS